MQFENATLVANLCWYDGPIIEIYELDGHKYLAAKSDFVNGVDIWVFGQVDEPTLQAYLDRQVSIREVWEKSPTLYEGPNSFIWEEVPGVKQITWADIPEERRPTTNSFVPK